MSDVLIDRGNSAVLTTIAGNFGARFSPQGYDTLVTKAGQDAGIASAMMTRPDMSPEKFKQLIARATSAVRERMSSLADPARKERINEILQDISAQMTQDVDATIIQRGPGVSRLEVLNKGKLREELFEYASARRIPETAMALATLSTLSAETIRRLVSQHEFDALLIICKASGLGWPTAARAILELAADAKGDPCWNAATNLDPYAKLTNESAERVIRFLKVRNKVSTSDLKQALAS